MARSVVFRAMKDDMSDPRMIYGDLVYYACKSDRPRITTDGGRTFHSCIAGTVGLYSGVVDSKNRVIYEGDICNVTCEGFSFSVNRLISFSGGQFLFDTVSLAGIIKKPGSIITIIGNIHKNSELLDKEFPKGGEI